MILTPFFIKNSFREYYFPIQKLASLVYWAYAHFEVQYRYKT